MLIGLCSDLHFHLGKKSDYIDIIFKSLDFFFSECSKKEITKVVICGDVVEYKDRIEISVQDKLLDYFREKKADGFEIYFVVGNHETLNRVDNEINFLKIFSDSFFVAKDYEVIEFEKGITCHFLPYFKDDILMDEKIPLLATVPGKNYLFTHLSFKNFDVGGGHEDIWSELESSVIEEIGFDHVFSGHYHKHSTKGKTTYISSPMVTNFGEAGEEKYHGFVFADLSKNKFTFIQNPHTIKYKKVELTKETLKDMLSTENYFYQVFLKKVYEQSYLEKIKQKIEEKNFKVQFKYDLNKGNSSLSKIDGWTDMISQKPIDLLKSFVSIQKNKTEEEKKYLIEFIER